MSRYLVTTNANRITRVERETEHYYHSERIGRWKKHHGDVLFDTFEQAYTVVVSVAEARLDKAIALKESDTRSFYGGSVGGWNDLPEAIEREGLA